MLGLPCLADELVVRSAWVREAPSGLTTNAAYMELFNPGDTPVDVVAVHAKNYAVAMIHVTKITDERTTMSSVESIRVPAGGSVRLEPGAMHLMLMDADVPIHAGDEVDITLCYADGTHQTITATVRRP